MRRRILAGVLSMLPLDVQATELCDVLALEYRAAALRMPGEVPALKDLPKIAKESPELEPFEAESDEQARVLLKRRFNAVGEEFNDLASFGRFSVTRLGRTSIFALWDIQGTAHCSYYFFLNVPGAAPAKLVEEPWLAEGTDFCWSEFGWLGEVAGQPVFATQTHDWFAPAFTISVTPWRSGDWGETCAVEAAFEPVFRVTESAFRTGSWPELVALAPDMAATRQLQDDSYPFSYRELGDQTKFAAMKALAAGLQAELPRFGGAYEGYDTFGAETPYFPLVLNNRTYLARIGHGRLGWRVSSDFLFGVWDLVDGALEPVAGLVISTEPGKLTSLKVSRSLPVTPELQP